PVHPQRGLRLRRDPRVDDVRGHVRLELPDRQADPHRRRRLRRLGSRWEGEVMAEVPQWRIAGDWFDVCKCTIPCPCTFAQAPSEGDCEGILAWHIREGSYGDVRLDGLNVVALGAFEGNLWAGETKATMGIYMDERADDGQRDALQMIFGGEAG